MPDQIDALRDHTHKGAFDEHEVAERVFATLLGSSLREPWTPSTESPQLGHVLRLLAACFQRLHDQGKLSGDDLDELLLKSRGF